MVFEGMEAVFLSFDTVIAGDIDIPPSAAIIGTVPSVEIGSVVAVIAVEDIARNAVTADSKLHLIMNTRIIRSTCIVRYNAGGHIWVETKSF